MLQPGQVGGDGGPPHLQCAGAGSHRHPGPRNPRRKASGSIMPAARAGTQAGRSPCWRGREDNPSESQIQVQPPRVCSPQSNSNCPRPPPVFDSPSSGATKLASKPIGHCQQLRANPLPHTRTAAFDWPFRIDLKIKPHQEKGQYRGY